MRKPWSQHFSSSELPIWSVAGSRVAFLLLFAVALCGATRRVPQEYTTIEAAFDAVLDNDTVLVSLGTYAEELFAPPHRFWLLGDVEVDTGNFAKPTIDPSTLDSAQWRRCMTIPEGCELTIERMAFINRAPMYPRSGWNVGGIFAETELPTTFRFCLFDSIWIAISDNIGSLPPRVRYKVEDCHFTNAPAVQIHARLSGLLEVRRCFFQGHRSRSRLVHGGDSTWVEDCVFTADSTAQVLRLWGENLMVRNCIIGPIDTCAHDPVIFLTADNGAIVEHCVFQDIRTITPDGFCIFQWNGGDPLIFRHNALLNYHGSFAELQFSDEPSTGEVTAIIDSNLFQNSLQDSAWAEGKTLWLWLRASVTGNHFVELLPQSVSAVLSYGASWAPPNELRYNQFQPGDYAIYSPYTIVDAIYNYWGDPTGPYNATYNPGGLGAQVDDLVQFDPWSPDTNFLSVPGLGAPLPKEFVLEAYPNPFNSKVRLKLIPASVQIVKVELFDVLGRKVEEMWKGPLAFQKEIEFDASALASGIYFARVTDVISRKQMAMKKLVQIK